MASESQVTIWTVGHSTHPVEKFIAMVRAHGVEQIVDVRTIPRSRHNPQYGQDSLAEALGQAGIRYRHLKALGGLRPAKADSVNTGWRNSHFRGYADYMLTEDFQRGIDQLMELAASIPSAIMCAEAVPWKCHRSLIGDALLARGVRVLDILSETKVEPHVLTEFAELHGTAVTYPGKGARSEGAKNLRLEFDGHETLR